jgi:hypothetical protein
VNFRSSLYSDLLNFCYYNLTLAAEEKLCYIRNVSFWDPRGYFSFYEYSTEELFWISVFGGTGNLKKF